MSVRSVLARRTGRRPVWVGLVVAVLLTAGTAVAVGSEDEPVEDYAAYQPQTKCRDHARPGTEALAEWINERFDGGTASASMRSCDSGGTSEHKDGRAVDWTMDASKKAHRKEVRRFLERLFDTDGEGNAHARARRMGIMYVIWNDHSYASYREFERADYLSSSCPSTDRCSSTLRHRDHVHISLSRRGARGDTSWYAGRI